jgi:GNAT superfamily N-acetyltransferase
MVEIVKAEERHFSELSEVWKEFMDFHKRIDPYLTRKEDGHIIFINYMRELMAKPEENLLLVALDSEHVVGYSLSMVAKRAPVFEQQVYGLISDMAVAGGYRRKGVGEKMLAEIFKWFRSKGINRVELSVAHGNPLGGPFWKKQGFKDYLHRVYRDI